MNEYDGPYLLTVSYPSSYVHIINESCYSETFFMCPSQESERAARLAAGLAAPLPRHGSRPEPRGAQGRVEDEGTEAAGRHQEPEGETAASGEPPDIHHFDLLHPGSSNTPGL